MQLIPNWKQAWRWASVNCMASAAIIQTTWISIPDDLRETMPHNIVHIITILLLVLGIGGRLTMKGKSDADALGDN